MRSAVGSPAGRCELQMATRPPPILGFHTAGVLAMVL